MVVLADKLSSSLAGRTGHVLYMHLQNGKLLLKMGKNPRLIYLWFCPLGCIITEQIHACMEQSGSMENYRLASPWKHLTP